MSQQNVDIVKKCFDLFNRGELDRLADEFMDPDVVWSEPDVEGAPIGGIYRGADEVKRGVWQEAKRLFADFRIETDRFIDAGEHVLAQGQYVGTVRETGARFSVPFMELVQLRNGRIVRDDVLLDTATLMRAMGGQVAPV